MHNTYNKAIIFLNGVNCKNNTIDVLEAITNSLKKLQLPYEIYQENQNGFKSLQKDMNQPNTLYILNDSVAYHLCEKPNILITRSPVWVQSTVKPCTIGVFIKEMLIGHEDELIACIARNKQVAQPHDIYAPKNYILVNEYNNEDLDVIARNGLAAISWRILSAKDIHAKVLFHFADDFDIPKVNDILREGIEVMNHPDDIIIFINRDICMVPEATTIIRNYMENYNIDAVSARRVDIPDYRMYSFDALQKMPVYAGIDLFAFKKSSKTLQDILNVDLFIGHYFWDTYWNVKINHELPYNIIYHLRHDSDWQKDMLNPYNEHNKKTVHQHLSDTVFNYENSKKI